MRVSDIGMCDYVLTRAQTAVHSYSGATPLALRITTDSWTSILRTKRKYCGCLITVYNAHARATGVIVFGG